MTMYKGHGLMRSKAVDRKLNYVDGSIGMIFC